MSTSSSPALSLYRQLLRTSLKMPDQHRVNLVVWRVRTEYEKSRSLSDHEEISERVMEAEIYLDNLQHQLQHLSSLSSTSLLIPLDIRSSTSSCTNPDHHHSLRRRRLIGAIQARENQREGMRLVEERKGRFMRGPEPSWVTEQSKKGAGGREEALQETRQREKKWRGEGGG